MGHTISSAGCGTNGCKDTLVPLLGRVCEVGLGLKGHDILLLGSSDSRVTGNVLRFLCMVIRVEGLLKV